MNIVKLSRRMFSSAKAKRIDFFYDVASPYSWYSFEVLLRYKKYWNVDLELQPVLLGGVFKTADNTSPMLASTAKVIHLLEDIKRCAKYYEVPLVPMKNMTDLISKGSLSPMRFLTAVKMIFPEHLEAASRTFWMIRWNQDRDFSLPEVLREVAIECGMSEDEVNAVLKKTSSEEVKTQLKDTTAKAAELGAFGVPTYVVYNNDDHSLFFGADRLPILAQEIKEEWRGPNPDRTSKL